MEKRRDTSGSGGNGSGRDGAAGSRFPCRGCTKRRDRTGGERIKQWRIIAGQPLPPGGVPRPPQTPGQQGARSGSSRGEKEEGEIRSVTEAQTERSEVRESRGRKGWATGPPRAGAPAGPHGRAAAAAAAAGRGGRGTTRREKRMDASEAEGEGGRLSQQGLRKRGQCGEAGGRWEARQEAETGREGCAETRLGEAEARAGSRKGMGDGITTGQAWPSDGRRGRLGHNGSPGHKSELGGLWRLKLEAGKNGS